MRLDPNDVVKPPYDIAGWTLPMQMGVEVVHVSDALDVETVSVSGPVTPEAGQIRGNAAFGYALSHDMNASIKAVNRLLRDGYRVHWSAEEFRSGRATFSAGTFVVEAPTDEMQQGVALLSRELGLDFAGLRSRPSGELDELHLPRVGLYKSYVPSMDEGWTRWLLEDYGFELVSMTDRDMRTGNLSSLDAVILPHPDGGVPYKDGASRILTGHPPGSMPRQYTGGLGLEGALALQRFVQDGGTVVALGDAVDFVINQFGLPIRDVVVSAPAEAYSVPGSLLRGSVSAANALAYGMPEEAALTVVGGAAFDTIDQDDCTSDLLNQRFCAEIAWGGRPLKEYPPTPRFDTVVTYATENALMSGWAVGTEHIAGKSAMARVPHGEGSVIVYGFRPQFRGQPRGTYKLLFNALHVAAMH
jgi:hypothetical protein